MRVEITWEAPTKDRDSTKVVIDSIPYEVNK
jgi:hypothetical protein